MNDDTRDRVSQEAKTDERAVARSKYHQALEELRAIADDFSEGSQQRWMLKLREVSALRDDYWFIQQRDGRTE